MEIFNIVVGVFSIMGSVASIVAVFYLHNISMGQRNSGTKNTNQMQVNKGKNNKNINVRR